MTLVHWPLPGGQLDAYSHALRFYGPSVEWLAFFDVDEFIVPLVDDDIPTLLARWPDAADVRMPRVDFGFSGHREPPAGLTIEAYTEVADVFGRDPAKPPRVKTVLRSRSVSAVGIHTATVADVHQVAEGRPVPHATIGAACHPYVQVNHYYTRSFEEFEAKRFRGSATGRIARPAIPFDLPTLRVDTSAQRFAERTRRAMDAHAQPGAQPLPLRQPAGARAVPALQRPRALRRVRRRQRRGRRAGAAARAAPAHREPLRGLGLRGPDLRTPGTCPSRGDLSTSVHLAPLLERARGRLEASWAGQPERMPAACAGAPHARPRTAGGSSVRAASSR